MRSAEVLDIKTTCCVWQVCEIHQSLDIAWGLRGTYMEFAWNVLGTYMALAWDLLGS